MAIGTVEFDLSMIDQETGRYMTARAYTVDGITDANNLPRELSIGQLVMAICLDRASKLEASIIALMEEMNLTSEQLQNMTKIEEAVVNYFAQDNVTNHAFNLASITFTGTYSALNGMTFLDDKANSGHMGVIAEGIQYVRDDKVLTTGLDILLDDFISALEAKMDEKNSFSQQKMIELQSQTSKRDQCYDMISNILKSLNTVLVGNANNL